jgi:multiple sugar transport system ATP-binding protein
VATVKFEHVWKQFGAATVLRDLNLEVREGEFLALLGPSGCGKTTTLRILGGLETPSYGKVLFDDEDVTLWSPGRRDIAMVFQSYALYPHMSIYGNLAFGPRVRHESKADLNRRIDEVAEVLDIKHLLKRRPGQLSGGQRQRVALGRALLRHPRLFLLDEPLSNLDASLRVQMRTELVRLHNTLGVTTVYVTHDQVEAMTMGHRVAVFDRGNLLQIGTPNELYDQPVNTFVAGFLGSPKMNFVPGEFKSMERGRVSIDALGQVISLPGSVAQAKVGKTVTLGIRPHDVDLSANVVAADSIRVRGILDAVEHTGSEIFAELITESGSRLMARLDRGAPVAVGETIEVAFAPSRAHLFDADSGARILHVSTPDGCATPQRDVANHFAS